MDRQIDNLFETNISKVYDWVCIDFSCFLEIRIQCLDNNLCYFPYAYVSDDV